MKSRCLSYFFVHGMTDLMKSAQGRKDLLWFIALGIVHQKQWGGWSPVSVLGYSPSGAEGWLVSCVCRQEGDKNEC